MSKVLIFGATGNVGHEVVRLLSAAGHEVVATTRRPSAQPASPGVRWVAVDAVTGEGVDAAFAGVSRAFLLSPPGHADQHAVLAPLLAAASRHQLAKVVLMTAQGVEHAPPEAPFRRAELALEASGLPHAILRPGWFMQNFHTFWAGGIQARDAIEVPAGDARTGFIDARDIAAVAAALVVRDGTDGGLTLTGPEALTHAEVAARLSSVAGRTIRYDNVSPEAFREGLLRAGLPADYAQVLVTLFEGVRAGWAAGLTGEVRRVTGREPISFAQYASDFRQAYARG